MTASELPKPSSPRSSGCSVKSNPSTGVARMQLVEQWDPWGGKTAPGDTPDAGVVDAAVDTALDQVSRVAPRRARCG